MVSIASRLLRACAQDVHLLAPNVEDTSVVIVITGMTWWRRIIPLSRGRHLPGFSVVWPGQPSLPVESRLEHKVLKALAAESTCVAIGSQPVTIRYSLNGSLRKYTPDFIAAIRSERSHTLVFIEVKPAARLLEKSQTIAALRRVVLLATAIPLVVVTDGMLEQLPDSRA